MSTEIKVSFREQSKAIVTEVSIKSSELTAEQVLFESEKLFMAAYKKAQSMALTCHKA